MGLHDGDYLKRRQLRLWDEQLSRQIVFGLGVGTAAMLFGAYQYFLVIGANDRWWRGVTIAGFAAFCLTLVLPAVWSPCVAALQWFGEKAGPVIFTVLLVPLYFLLVWPAGVLLRAMRGGHPVYSWDEGSRPPENMEGWRTKSVAASDGVGRGRASLFLQPFFVIGFFLRQGHYVMIPLLVALIVIGLLLFFLQTSVFAPLIYPLF